LLDGNAVPTIEDVVKIACANSKHSLRFLRTSALFRNLRFVSWVAESAAFLDAATAHSQESLRQSGLLFASSLEKMRQADNLMSYSSNILLNTLL
jgi:hypothetical protein